MRYRQLFCPVPFIILSFIILLALIPRAAASQGSTRPIRGVVVAASGNAIENANVFILETLEGATTGPDGRFQLSVDSGSSIVARAVGYTPFTLKLPTPLPDSVVITLERAAPELTPITVMASSYTASEERTATLTPLEVVTIPGTAADVNRALQTLPGIQQVDEGTGLFVRGGDAYETKVFLNDAALLNPMDIQSPNGTFMGTVDPFLLDGIVFSSGGFGARYGNALSAAVSLTTQGRPSRRALAASAGLAGVSVAVGQPINPASGIRVAGNLFDLRPLIALNGSSRKYDPAPRGHDISASLTALSPRFGELRIFAIQQTNSLGIGVTEPGYDGTFALSSKSNLAIASWNRDGNRTRTSLTLSASGSTKKETYGTFDLGTRLSQALLFVAQEWTRSELLTLRGGGEIDHTGATFEGSIPDSDLDVAPGSRTRVIESDEAGTRLGVFLEADTRVLSRVRLVTGVRSDHSTLTDEATLDPRISLAIRAKGSAHITAAWGIYHQIPDPLLFDAVLGNASLGAMRATHSILGFQIGDNAEMIRVEMYRKEYENLTRQTRDYSVSTGLTGSSYGADFFVKGLVLGNRGRVTYSYARSTRLDADSRVEAASPFDVPHTLTLVLQRSVRGFDLGAAYRHASGRPFTPVIDATFNAADERWVPVYGSPSSERLPDLKRLDFSVSRMQQLLPGWQVVTYASVNNVLGRHNIYNYTWSSDYKHRIPVASLFDRSLYVGATILH